MRLERGPRYPEKSTIYPPGFVIAADQESDEFPVSFGQTINESAFEALLKTDEGRGGLFFYGFIIYEDIFGNEHTTGFALTWDREYQALRQASDEEAPGYNYNRP